MGDETMTTQAGKMAEPDSTQAEESFLSNVISDIFGNVFNLFLVGVIIVLIYKIFKSHTQKPISVPQEKPLPKLRKDFTVEELRPYDGNGPDGRILVAVNGKVFDVTRGKRYYGKDGPYAAFAGRDASRGLATFSVTCAKEEYDDLADLDSFQMDSVLEWEIQFREKYDQVGKLLKPGEQPTNYSDEEEEPSTVETDKDKDKKKSD